VIKQLLGLLLISITTLSCNTFKIPEYKEFRNLSFEKAGFSESTIKMELVYNNPNRFGFQVRKTECDVYVDDVYLGRAISDTLIKVDKKSDFAIPIYIKTDMKNLFKNAWIALTNKTVLVRATGTITAGVAGIYKTIPLSYEGRHEASLFLPVPLNQCLRISLFLVCIRA
jgi:LEA14-like dessication related protein